MPQPVQIGLGGKGLTLRKSSSGLQLQYLIDMLTVNHMSGCKHDQHDQSTFSPIQVAL
jgi:hypothetical protein